jgi:hypothetical protein
MSVPQHIVDRLEDHLDGKLDHAGRAALIAWLQESDENPRSLAEWFMAEVELHETARVADMCAVFEGMTFDPKSEEPETTVLPGARRVTFTVRGSWLAIAATAAFVLAGAYLLATATGEAEKDDVATNQKSAAADGATTAKNDVPSPAILSRLANCVWAGEMTRLRVGQDILAGTTLELKSGLAKLFFESGAEVVLKGPCRIRIESSMRCRLDYGSVSAEVPSRAAGFTIRGPSSEVIDLGTRFGFSVGNAGKSEVHVFQGEVISRQLDKSGKVFGDEIRLTKNQAILYPGELQQAQRLAADEAKFTLEVKPLWRKDAIEPLVVDRSIAFWLRAEHGVQTDRQNRVIAWQDLALGDNYIANDAFQPDNAARPKYVVDGLGGRPALRFNGQRTFLTTTPMTTTDDQTIVVVFRHAPPRPGKRVGGQIINYNGPPSRYLPNIYNPGVLQLGEKVSGRNGPIASIAAKAFVGRDSGGTDVSAGLTVSESLGHQSPHVAAYIYDNTMNAATLYVDGNRVAEASAPTSVAVTSRKVIGKHGIFDQWYYHGDLSEVIIFNAALSPKEVNDLSRQLMSHYGISTSIQQRHKL